MTHVREESEGTPSFWRAGVEGVNSGFAGQGGVGRFPVQPVVEDLSVAKM